MGGLIERYKDQLDMPLRAWVEHHQRTILQRTSWMGVPMLKTPLDAWIIQEIIWETHPEAIIEIGSFAGGSTLYYAHLLDTLNGGRVISVDIDRSRFVAEHARIDVVTGDSADPGVLARVAELCDGRRTMVIHDGDHTRDRVLADLRAYAEFVTVGSYFIVEDGIVDLFDQGGPLHPAKIDAGPLHAIDRFLREDERFEADRRRERFLVTWNPSGYLRRVS